MNSQFYITLPSNTRCAVENGASQFTTRLPQRLILSGEWECSLSEIIYPHSWENLTQEDAKLYITMPGDGILVEIPPGHYSNIRDLISVMQWKIKNIGLEKYANLKDDLVFSYSIYDKRATVAINSKTVSEIRFSDKLCHILGFKNSTVRESSRAEYPADLRGGFQSLYVYCNVIESQIVGDTLAPLLRIISIEGVHDDIIDKIFVSPHYVPVQIKDISTIEIGIRDDTNKPVRFVTGKTVLKLHFRKKSYF